MYFAACPATISSGAPGRDPSCPSRRLAVVADELLVEAVLRAAGLVRVAGPEARRVGRERLVAEDEGAVGVEPELELRVRDDDPGRAARGRRRPVEAAARPLDLREAALADELRSLLARDVLVVALCAFVAGVKIGSGACPTRETPPAAVAADLAAGR
jgi:hypothetical protein